MINCDKYSDLFWCRNAVKNHVLRRPEAFIELYAIFVCLETNSS